MSNKPPRDARAVQAEQRMVEPSTPALKRPEYTGEYPGNLFMVVAPSGAGKSTLVNALLEGDESIRLSISYTTRAPRPNEKHGREYLFVTVEEFHERRRAGEF